MINRGQRARWQGYLNAPHERVEAGFLVLKSSVRGRMSFSEGEDR